LQINEITMLNPNSQTLLVNYLSFDMNFKAKDVSEKAIDVNVVIAFNKDNFYCLTFKTLENFNHFFVFVDEDLMIRDPEIENIAEQV
ncbi:MAG TPA: hypothetical protein PLU50_06360, partial [Pseudobdellovibrionaceae bacterium]|nr:hypothetical protein [Pseudobdellovibrionaceae bacterium]